MLKLQRAIALEPHEIIFPKLAQPKIDGVRAVVLDGVFYSRKGIAIPNKHVQAFAKELPSGWDGEIVVGSVVAPDVFSKTMSGVMAIEGEPDFKFICFDSTASGGYRERYSELKWSDQRVMFVSSKTVNNLVELVDELERCLTEGYEGVMLRNSDSAYKHGTASKKTQELIKVKQFSDDEARIVGHAMLQSNQNEAQKDALGRTKRSSAKAGKVETTKLGSFVVLHPDYGTFEVGSGYTEAQRVEFGANPNKYLNKYITFKYMKAGMKDKPRFPIFKGFRDVRDII